MVVEHNQRRTCTRPLSKVGIGWEDIILPGVEDPRNCPDPQHLGQSESDQSWERWSVYLHCMTRWDGNEMTSIYYGVCRIYTPHHSIYTRYPSLYLRTPAVAPCKCWQCVRSTCQRSGFWPAVRFGLGRYPAKNPNRYLLAGMLPRPNRNRVFFSRVGTGPRVHVGFPRFLAPIKYLSSDRIMTWCICRVCSLSRSFTSRF